MRFNIDQIKSRNGSAQAYTLTENVADVQSRHFHIVFDGPVQVSARIQNENGTLFLTGTARGAVIQKCDRCLETYHESFDVEFSDEIHPAHRPVDTLDFYRTYEGSLLDLDDIIQEAVIVGMPMTRVCSENCQGICGGCGKNLNLEKCICEENPYNPRMEILKKLLKEE